MDAEKMKRLRHASKNDEEPLVKAFTDMGVPANRNTDVKKQKAHGDVLLTFTDGTRRSVESQVSTSRQNFSYSLSKVLKYVGPGLPEHAYVMLGCKQDSASEKMIYMICQAIYLHQHLGKMNPKDGKDYYVIPPGDLHALQGVVGFGDTIPDVVQDFLRNLSDG